MTLRNTLLFLLTSATLTACGGGGGGNANLPPASISSSAVSSSVISESSSSQRDTPSSSSESSSSIASSETSSASSGSSEPAQPGSSSSSQSSSIVIIDASSSSQESSSASSLPDASSSLSSEHSSSETSSSEVSSSDQSSSEPSSEASSASSSSSEVFSSASSSSDSSSSDSSSSDSSSSDISSSEASSSEVSSSSSSSSELASSESSTSESSSSETQSSSSSSEAASEISSSQSSSNNQSSSAPGSDNDCDNGYLICTNFDEHSNQLPSGWSASNERVAITTEKAYSGTQSLKVSATGGGYNSNMLSYSLSAHTELKESMYGRMMINLNEQNSKSADFTFIQADGAPRAASGAYSDVNVMYRGRVDGRNDHFMANYDTWNPAENWKTDCWKHPQNINQPPADYLIPKNTWACVQWHFDASKNTLQFWLDGKELSQIQVVDQGDGCVANAQNGIWWGPESFRDIRLGIEQYHGHATTRTMYIDDVAIDNRVVACPVEPGTPPASSSSSEASSSVSSSSSSSSSSSAPVVISDAPVANGLCAANSGLGDGATAKEHIRAVLQDGSAVTVYHGNATEITNNSGGTLSDIIAITNGTYADISGSQFCAIRSNGGIYCGEGNKLADTASYTPSSPNKAAISISSDTINGTACALLADHSVICGSKNGFANKALSEPITQLSCFRNDSCCGVTENGGLACWGINTPTQLPAGNALMVSGGDASRCAVYDDGKAYCWGAGWSGELGGLPDQQQPTAISLSDTVVGSAGGQFHNCWLHSNGSVSCSGNGGGTPNGAGGGGSTPSKIKTTSGAELSNIVAINGGRSAACAATSNGDLYCWGDAGGHALGNEQENAKAVKINLGNRQVRLPAQCIN